MSEISEERWRELERLAEQARFLEEPVHVYAAPLLQWVAATSAPAVGARLGSYEIVRELGRGGMATVYLARDRKHDRDVALKVLHAELAAAVGAERFLGEIRVTAGLTHPHILTLIDSGESNGFLWYALPSVPGASLRQRLDRETRLSVGDAVTITRHIATALDHAHLQGFVHRDVKPENILLHEGEAMLADFGIAVAIQDAGGDRLAGAGIGAGTLHYMSPEQAAGDGGLDARTDVYSLGMVLYEMLVGTPPHTGSTPEDVIAKITTERPASLRTVRNDVSRELDVAIARALAKDPNERFASAGVFAKAVVLAQDAPPRRRRRAVIIGTGGVLLAVAAWLLNSAPRVPDTLVGRDRTQLTFTGNAVTPAISPDGQELAYVVKSCTAARCRYGIEIQDLRRERGKRLLLDDATMIYEISWSPDRAHLVFRGTLGGRFGPYIIATNGGSPRFITTGHDGAATFLPNGDSLLTTSPVGSDGIAWLRVTTLDGDPRDSIPVERPGRGVLSASMVEGHRWIIVEAGMPGGFEWRILDRRGRQRDVFHAGQTGTFGSRVTRDAVWLLVPAETGPGWMVQRHRIDVQSGRFAGVPDTILLVSQASFDVSADGNSIVYAEGTYRWEVWALELSAALRGEFPAVSRRLSATAESFGTLSPDGRRVLLYGPGDVISIAPYRGIPTIRHSMAGGLLGGCAGWMQDGSSPWYAERFDGKARFVTLDARTGEPRSVFPITDSTALNCAPLGPDKWVWIPHRRALHMRGVGDRETRVFPKPAEDGVVWWVASTPDGSQILTQGWSVGRDSILVHALSVADGRILNRAAFWGEWAISWFLQDGTILVAIWDGSNPVLYRLRAQGRVERIGVIPIPVGARITPSLDGSRLGITTREFQGDIWLARLDRPR